MPEARRSIFNAKASEKLRSPDDLDKYIRVTNPSVWIVLLACIVLLVGMLAWGIFGTVETSVKATGVAVGEKVYCFLDTESASKVHVDDSANVGGAQASVKSISEVPFSRDEARSLVESDYLVSTLISGDWAYVIEFSTDEELQQNVPVSVYITTERIPPISLILGGNA